MKHCAKKFFSWSAILSIMLSVLVVPGAFSASALASSAGQTLGTAEVQPHSDGLFPITCVSNNVDNGTFSVSSNDPSATFILNLYDFNHQKLLSSSEVVGEGKLTFDGKTLYPRYFGVSNKANAASKFAGALSVEGESLYLHCFKSPDSAASSISSGIFSFFAGIIGLLF